MTATLTNLVANLTASLDVTAKKTDDGILGSFPTAGAYQKSHSFTFGSGVGKANCAYFVKAKSIAASGTLALDLQGTLPDAFGDNAVFDNIRCMYIFNDSAAAGITIGGNAAEIPLFAAVNDKLVLPAKCGLLMWGDNAGGFVNVTATTGDILSLINTDGSNAASVDICLIGDSV